ILILQRSDIYMYLVLAIIRANLYISDIMKRNSIKTLALEKFGDADPNFYASTIYEHLRRSHLHINKPHKHHFYASMLFTSGSGQHEIDFKSYEVKPGM